MSGIDFTGLWDGLTAVGATAGIRPTAAAQPTEPTASAAQTDDAVLSDTFPSAPPPEVQAAVAAAGSAYEKLASAGLHVAFQSNPGGRVGAELQDLSGTPLRSLSPSEVVGLAGGDDVPTA